MLKFFKRPIFKRRVKHKRSFQAANIGRLFGAWTINNTTLDAELKNGLRSVRARSRDLSINNDYYVKYLQLICANVIGHSGIKLQSRIVDFNGKQDTVANSKIEAAFKDWGKSVDITGRLSWVDAQNMFIESVARDGEVLIKKIRNRKYKYGFKLQFLEADLLDENYNEQYKNGNQIKMGIEVDKFGAPIAYHLLQQQPGSDTYHSGNNDYIRVPAEDIIHPFRVERPTQTRGYPWGVAAFTRIKNLEGYEEAAITAARIGASKMGFYTTPDGQYTGDDKDENGNPISEMEPGIFEVLPEGMDFKSFDPDYPHDQFDAFMKRTIKGIASGLGIPYVSLASDMEGVSYSSIRQGELEARDFWRTLQKWMIDNFMQPVFEEWLSSALLTQDLALPFDKFDKFNAAQWQPRGWAWVDPSKDVKAKVLEIENGLKSKTTVIGEMGGDYFDTQQQLADEKETEKALGLVEEPEEPNNGQT